MTRHTTRARRCGTVAFGLALAAVCLAVLAVGPASAGGITASATPDSPAGATSGLSQGVDTTDAAVGAGATGGDVSSFTASHTVRSRAGNTVGLTQGRNEPDAVAATGGSSAPVNQGTVSHTVRSRAGNTVGLTQGRNGPDASATLG